jgi:hypothetical protein
MDTLFPEQGLVNKKFFFLPGAAFLLDSGAALLLVCIDT